MKETIEHGSRTIRPDPDGILTVRELIEALTWCDPDAGIVIGSGLDDCEETLERIVVGRNLVLLATESEDTEE